MEEEKETSSENKTVDARSAVDDAVEETKKRTILGDGDGVGDDNTTNEGADAAAIPDEHDEVEDVEKGSMENCDVEKDESGDGEPADDSDTKRSSPLQSSPPKRRKSGTGEPSSSEVDLSKQIYHVKWIGWHDTRCPIIMQNVNGPCPLLSMINVLLLRGKMTLKEGTEVVSSEQLLENIADFILNSLPSEMPSSISRLDYEQNMNDAIALLPKLHTGLDVNVKFCGVAAFEYTDTCVIFDLLNISLYHGWLTDPQETEVTAAVGGNSYNQLVDKIITGKESEDVEKRSLAWAAHRFLEESASQLTYHGLCELGAKMNEGELAVFFRNNHFSTIYKQKTELFLLVTDQGFLKEPRVVWETLSDIDGDCHFVDEKFVTAPPKEESAVEAALPVEPLTPEQQIDRDHMIALQMAEEDKAYSERAAEWEKFKTQQFGVSGGAQGGPTTTVMSDEELAKRLQDEENRQAAEAEAATQQRQQRQQQQHQGGGVGEQPTAPPRHQQHQQQQHGPHPSSSRHPLSPSTRDRDSQRSGNKNCIIL